MNRGRTLLTLGAVVSFAIALLHVGLAFAGPDTARFFGAPRWVLPLVEQRSWKLIPVLLVIVGLLGAFGLYAWSGAGRMRRLPVLRAGLIGVTTVYLLRGLVLFPLLVLSHQRPGGVPWQFFAFSLVALLLGLIHLAGVTARWPMLRAVDNGAASSP